jgi:NADH dehydrogenase FAD-containing subunit
MLIYIIFKKMKDQQTIVIIGGGFAGIELAERLLKSEYDASVILVDKNNYNFFHHCYIRWQQAFWMFLILVIHSESTLGQKKVFLYYGRIARDCSGR